MCQRQLAACDVAIDAALQTLTAAVTPPTTPLPRRLRTHVDTLGFALVDRETGELLEGTVS